jgi:hypothetical protein
MNVKSMYSEKSRYANLADCISLTFFTELLYTNLIPQNFQTLVVVFMYILSISNIYMQLEDAGYIRRKKSHCNFLKFFSYSALLNMVLTLKY